MRQGAPFLGQMVLGALCVLSSCTGGSASKEQLQTAAKILSQSIDAEVASLVKLFDKTSLSFETCPESSADGCTTWCPDSKKIARACELRKDDFLSCANTPYKISNPRTNFQSDYSQLESVTASYRGVLTSKLDYSVAYTGASDTTYSGFSCSVSLTIGIDASSVISRRMDCQHFTCSFQGVPLDCKSLQRAMDSLTCKAASSGDGSGGGGGSSGGGGDSGSAPTKPGSCTDSSGRCQDFTGSSWLSLVVQAQCATSKGTYSADLCPTANRVGSCTIQSGQATEVVLRFYSPSDPTLSSTLCTSQGGVWSSN